MSKPAVLAAATCGSCIVVIGIVCLVLGLMGYFNFEEPCVEVKSFQIDSIERGGDGGFLGALTGGLLSTEIALNLTVVLEVNNTNVFDLDYEQGEPGIVVIPADQTPLDEDLPIGTWTAPKGTLKKEAVNLVPVIVNAAFDLVGSGAAALATNFVTGGPIVFRITGGVDGKGWVPGMTGENTFVCDATLDDVLNAEESATVNCKHSTSVAGVDAGAGESETSLTNSEEDTSCYV
jgi:hypothetical protein